MRGFRLARDRRHPVRFNRVGRSAAESRAPMADLEIGVMLNNLERDRLKAFRVAAASGFHVVHTSALPEAWLTGPERDRYTAAARESGLTIHRMFVGFDGQTYADLPAIRRRVGLVIPALREHRTQVALRYCDLAREMGSTHLPPTWVLSLRSAATPSTVF